MNASQLSLHTHMFLLFFKVCMCGVCMCLPHIPLYGDFPEKVALLCCAGFPGCYRHI